MSKFQDVANAAISQHSYSPKVPILFRAGWEKIWDTTDPENQHCLETLGDSRLEFLVVDLQVRLFPAAKLSAYKV